MIDLHGYRLYMYESDIKSETRVLAKPMPSVKNFSEFDTFLHKPNSQTV